MSRDSVVEAYSTWTAISDTEAICLGVAFAPGDRVLDLGCGAGRLANRLSGLAGYYLGIDASQPMILVAQSKHPELQFRQSDIVDLVFEPSSWDLILLMGNVLDCLHPVERRKRLIDQCVQWLRPGGSVIGSTHLTRPGQHPGYYSEGYHGIQVQNFRSALGDVLEEIESHGLEVRLLIPDERKEPPDWTYWVARRPVD